jgi:hypothetical protein
MSAGGRGAAEVARRNRSASQIARPSKPGLKRVEDSVLAANMIGGLVRIDPTHPGG